MAAERQSPATQSMEGAHAVPAGPGARTAPGCGRRPPDQTPGVASPIRRPPSLRAYVARSAAVCVAGLAINQTVAQAGSAALARWIPNPHLYGEVALLLQILQMATLALGVGLDSALVYDIATHRPEPGRTFAAARGGMLALAVLPVALCMLAARFVARAYGVPHLAAGLRLGAPILIAQAALNAVTALQIGLRHFGTQMALMVSGTILANAGRLAAVPVALAGGSIGWIALAGGAGLAVAATAGHVLAERIDLPGTQARPAELLADLPRMLRYGWPLWANNLLKAFQNPYLVLAAGVTGVAAAGYVANDVALIGWPFLVTWGFRLVTVPFIASAESDRDRRVRTAVCFRLNHLVLLPMAAVLVCWPREVLAAIYGSRYVDGAALLPLLVLGVYGSSVGRLATDALAAVAQTRASVPIMVVACAPLLLLAPLALRHGILWLGWLYCGGWLASAVFALWQLSRIGLAVDARTGFLEPLLPTAAALPLALLASHLRGPAGQALWAAAAVMLVSLTIGVYRWDGRPERGASGLVTATARTLPQ